MTCLYPTHTRLGRVFSGWLVLLILVACQPAQPPPIEAAPPENELASQAGSSTSQATATPLVDVDDTDLTSPARASDQLITSASDPLRIVFPTPGPAPVSAWRPPLYPVPWALTPFDHFYFARPIAADEINWPLADYRYGGVFFEDVVHSGVDIPAKVGTPVLAAGPGKVTWAGYGLYYGTYDETDPYGLAVFIHHDFGYQGDTLYTAYGHLDRVDVVKGQHVEAGEQIGLSGQTGKTTGPHLHFEVRLEKGGNFATRNPELWLVPPQGWGVLAGKVLNNNGKKLESQLVEVYSLESGQVWHAKSYSRGNINADPFYQENLVISDLPAGKYEIRINHLGKDYKLAIAIHAGLVSYFAFRGRSGFVADPPTVPGSDFTPTP